jgi:hypothetical protein
MRMAFGLVSLLISCLIVAMLWAHYTAQVAHVNKEIQPQVAQIAGRNADLTPASDSISLSSVEKADHTLAGLKVESIQPACAFEDFYGLQKGDVVRQIGPQGVGDSGTIDSVESGKDFLVDALEHKFDLTIERDGKTLHLPADKNAGEAQKPAAANATPGQANPATPANANPSNPTAAANPAPATNTPPVVSNPPRNASAAGLDIVNQLKERENQTEKQQQ